MQFYETAEPAVIPYLFLDGRNRKFTKIRCISNVLTTT